MIRKFSLLKTDSKLKSSKIRLTYWCSRWVWTRTVKPKAPYLLRIKVSRVETLLRLVYLGSTTLAGLTKKSRGTIHSVRMIMLGQMQRKIGTT